MTISYKGRHETWYTVAEFVTLNNLSLNHGEVVTLGKKATKLAKQRGYTVEKREEYPYGLVNMYPQSVLQDIFF